MEISFRFPAVHHSLNTSIYIFSQVNPTPDNLAVKMLSHEVQNRNVRKVKINAQITFVIYVLECIANTSIYILWGFVYGTSNHVTLGLAILWFHIILPYTFLMNTSHNKNRVMNDGWWNTIKNTFGHHEKSNTTTPSFMSKKSKIHPVDMGKGSLHKSTRDNPKLKKSSAIEIDRHTKDDIFIISNNMQLQPCSSSKSKLVLDDLEINVPLNSLQTLTPQQMQLGRLKAQSSESDEENQTPKRSDYLTLGESLFSYLEHYINNEEGYLHYLHQIATLEKINEENKTDHIEFEILHFSNIRRPNKKVIKRSRKNSSNKSLDKTKNAHLYFQSKNGPIEPVNHDKIMTGHFLDRIEARRCLLSDFKDHCNDEKSFNTFCNLVLDFEESLIRH